PTEAQEKAIPPILEGKNVLLISPTASGKTESAILPVFTRFLNEADRGPGVKIIYITPLRALNRDLLDRLRWWGQKIDLKVGVRHGDTEIKERASQSRSPPDLLITTPETLQAILPGRILRRHLRDIRFVIIDEVHELAEDKRGSQLAIALERLRWVAQRDFQMVGLSATIGSPDVVGKFLVGEGRPVEIVHIPVARRMKLEIVSPEPTGEDVRLAGKRLIQRVGRSGHSVGKMADGIIITMDSDDTLEAMVIARKAKGEDLEDVTVPEKPFDALCHQIAGLLIQNRKWYYSELLDILRKAYPYRNLTEEDVAAVTNYMHSRFPRLGWVSAQDKMVMRPSRVKDLYRYYFNKLSMIPDEKQYLVVEQESETAVGVLDEAFVAEYGQPGTKFIVRGTPWMMQSIRGDKIFVRGISDPTGAIPSWIGEEIPVPF